jgi:SAM-dependent methyltransferase
MVSARGYASLDAPHRFRKARKIEHLLGGVEGAELLDLGSGSGLLAEYLASRGAKVQCADRDLPPESLALPFTRIESDDLPFADAQFDVVVFNHVIEHVGDRPQQRAILREIDRVLKPGGRLYVAVPSKWALVEPHFRLPLLGALPRGLADTLVRRFRDFSRYDCYPLGLGEFHAMLSERFAEVTDLSVAAYKWVAEYELGGFAGAAARAVPEPLLQLGRFAFPTYVAICRKADPGEQA